VTMDRATADTAVFLSELRARDIRFSLDGGQLKCSAPAGALDPAMRQLLASRKTELLAYLKRAEAIINAPTLIVPIKPEGSRRPVFAVSGHGGDVYALLGFARHLDAAQPVLGVQPPGLDGSPPLTSVEALARFQIEQIRRVQPHGPYRIAGHCAGGSIAYEVAQQLTAAGEPVELLALIGGPFPTVFGKFPQLMRHVDRHVVALTSGSLADRTTYITTKLKEKLPNKAHSAASPDMRSADALARERVERTTVTAVARYSPRAYAGPIDIIITDHWHHAQHWRTVAAKSREHILTGYGGVNELLAGANVGVLAAVVQRRLTRGFE
jgi:thioesterase domain-containing protein